MNLAKKNIDPFFPILQKDLKKDPTIKADWAKWID